MQLSEALRLGNHAHVAQRLLGIFDDALPSIKEYAFMDTPELVHLHQKPRNLTVVVLTNAGLLPEPDDLSVHLAFHTCALDPAAQQSLQQYRVVASSPAMQDASDHEVLLDLMLRQLGTHSVALSALAPAAQDGMHTR
jgi:hypothetical protein